MVALHEVGDWGGVLVVGAAVVSGAGAVTADVAAELPVGPALRVGMLVGMLVGDADVGLAAPGVVGRVGVVPAEHAEASVTSSADVSAMGTR